MWPRRKPAAQPTPDDGSATPLQDIGAQDDFPEGTLKEVVLEDGTRLAVFRFNDEIHAVSGSCTHQEFPMSAGTVTHRGTIECAWHGAEFDCCTGEVKRGPATDRLPVYHVEVRDGRILVGGQKP